MSCVVSRVVCRVSCVVCRVRVAQPRGTFFAGHMAAHNAKARQNYHGMYEVLTGLKLVDPPGGSWIYGWQVWYRPYVEELLHHIAAKARRDDSEWAHVIIGTDPPATTVWGLMMMTTTTMPVTDTIVREAKAKPGMSMRNSFSEYDSYGSWVWMRHPQHVDFWHKSADLWVRYPEVLPTSTPPMTMEAAGRWLIISVYVCVCVCVRAAAQEGRVLSDLQDAV